MTRLVHALAIAAALMSGCKDQAQDQNGSEVKIFGGEPAKQGDPLASYTAALVKADGELVCSAVLISPQVLVTAAHCLLPEIMAGDLQVVFGLETKTGKKHPVKAYAIHPHYNPALAGSTKRSQYDIGLVAMAQPAPETYPVTMLSSNFGIEPYATVVKIAGYGFTDVGNKDMGILRFAPTNLSGDSERTQEVFIDGFRLTNACGGDSGGPALVLGEDNQVYLLGVASYVIVVNGRVCNSGFAAYSDLRAYKNWITNMVQRLPQLEGKVESQAQTLQTAQREKGQETGPAPVVTPVSTTPTAAAAAQ